MTTYKQGYNYAKVLKGKNGKGYRVIRGNPMNETVRKFKTKPKATSFAKKWIKKARKGSSMKGM